MANPVKQVAAGATSAFGFKSLGMALVFALVAFVVIIAIRKYAPEAEQKINDTLPG